MTSMDVTAIPLTMSTLEIAGLCGKRPDHVLRDADKMLKELGITGPKFGASYIDPTGRSLRCLNLPKRETLILVSGYRVDLRARIIDRWVELENALHADQQTALTEFSPAQLKVLGGVMKAVFHKQIAETVPAMVEEAIARDTRRAVLDYVSVRQLLDEAKCDPKGRNAVNRCFGFRLGLRVREDGGARRCPHTGVWLYPRALADKFMREEGFAMVKEHNDRVRGQGVLRLVVSKKAK